MTTDMNRPKMHNWKDAEAFAHGIAEQIAGARVVPRENDKAIDVRFKEGSVPVRIVLDVQFDDLEVSARAEDVSGTFDLFFDPKVDIDASPEEKDEWDEVEQDIFLGKSIFIRGSAASVAQQAALLRGLPTALLDELLATISSSNLPHVGLEDGVIEVKICDLSTVGDDGQTAIRTARVLGRVAGALPRGDTVAASDLVARRCAYCHALCYPSPERTACANCGAPL